MLKINSISGIYKHVIIATNNKVRTFLIVGIDDNVARECVFITTVRKAAIIPRKNAVIIH